MSKFVIDCPNCGKYAEAKTGFWIFGTRKIDCVCGYTIDVKTDKIKAKKCPQCGNDVVYDQSKGESALCPVCKDKINTVEDIKRLSSFSCPQCGCGLSADKSAVKYICPICDMDIDVQERIKLEDISKSGIASVIKYEGNNSTFVWKHPVEDFNIGSQLIVHESQEAVFFRNGQALDSFSAGRYTLETDSIPLINKIYNSVLDPKGMFHSEVYFVNLTTQMGIKWGTDSKVRFLEPVTGIPFEIGASGEFNLRACHPRKLILKLVGTEGKLDWSKLREDGAGANSLHGYFKGMIMTRVKTYLAKTIKENAINILEVDEHLDALSDALKERLNIELEEYGLTMPEFYVTNLVTPDEDKNFQQLKKLHAEQYLEVQAQKVRKSVAEAEAERKTVEARTDAQMRIINAQGGAEITKITAQAEAEAYRLKAEAEAKEMQMKGYTYAQETQRQIGLEAVQGGVVKEGGGGNSGLGDIVGLGVTLGTLGGVVELTKDALAPIKNDSADIGKIIGDNVNPSVTQVNPSNELWNCKCGEKNIKGNFCNNCGEKKPIDLLWDCVCGEKNIKGNFCNNCGKKREDI